MRRAPQKSRNRRRAVAGRPPFAFDVPQIVPLPTPAPASISFSGPLSSFPDYSVHFTLDLAGRLYVCTSSDTPNETAALTYAAGTWTLEIQQIDPPLSVILTAPDPTGYYVPANPAMWTCQSDPPGGVLNITIP